MLEDLKPLSLSACAIALGVDPFEVVRLRVVANLDAGPLCLGHDTLAKLREVGGIESWWTGRAPPEDENPLRGAVLGALGQLLERDRIGPERTRLDNLWRGLPPAQQSAIERAVMKLVDGGMLLTSAEPRGVMVSVTPESVEALRALAAGQTQDEGLNEVWQG